MPGPNRGFRKPNQKAKRGTMPRLLKLLFSDYPVLLTVVAICLVVNAIAGVVPSLFMSRVIGYIEIGLKEGLGSVKGSILHASLILLIVYLLSLACSAGHTFLMATVTQGFLNKMRQRMFRAMEKLPIRFFDRRTHGDIMSYYTNDIDTLRQLISQSLPNMLTSALTLVSVVAVMLYYSGWLTLLVFAGMLVMLRVTKTVGGKSANNCSATLHREDGRVYRRDHERAESGAGFLP